MDLDLHERAFVVSGASSGIGLATAQRLVREGARVCCFARDLDRLTAAFEDTVTPHDQLLLLAGDARRPRTSARSSNPRCAPSAASSASLPTREPA